MLLREVLESLLAPVLAVLRPGDYFERLRYEARRLPLLAKAALALGAWAGAAFITFFLTLGVGLARSILHGDVSGVLSAPFQAAVIAFILPLLAAGADSIIIMLAAAPAPREESLLLVPLVRASSLLPYTVRAALLAVFGKASLASLIAAGTHPLDLALLLAGAGLTAYGLAKTLGMPPAWAALAAAAPLVVKLVLGFL